MASRFFFNDTATTEIYTLSLHDALPISPRLATDTFSHLRTVTATGESNGACRIRRQDVVPGGPSQPGPAPAGCRGGPSPIRHGGKGGSPWLAYNSPPDARARYSISLSSNCGFRQTWKAHFRNWPQLFTASTQRFAAVCLAFVWSSSKPLISSTTVTPLLSRTRKSGS